MTSLLGPVTDADRRRWQDRAYKLLGELLERGWEHDLPPIFWRLKDSAVIVGEPVGSGDKRAVWEAWVTVLELDRWAEQPPTGSGRVHLHAVTKDWRGRHVDVAVIADVWEE